MQQIALDSTWVSITWEQRGAGSYRALEGRFTISRVNLGRCYGVRWILVDNRWKEKSMHHTLIDAQETAEQILNLDRSGDSPAA